MILNYLKGRQSTLIPKDMIKRLGMQSTTVLQTDDIIASASYPTEGHSAVYDLRLPVNEIPQTIPD
jgi:hypothetical protein